MGPRRPWAPGASALAGREGPIFPRPLDFIPILQMGRLRPLATCCFGRRMGTEVSHLSLHFRTRQGQDLGLTQQAPRSRRGGRGCSPPPQQRCCGSGPCSPGRPRGSRRARSCGSRRCSGCAPPRRPCARCPTPWWTGASSGGCPGAGPRRAAVRAGERREDAPVAGGAEDSAWRVRRVGDSGAPPSPPHTRQLREPEGVKTPYWRQWRRRGRTAKRSLGETAQQLAQGFGLWEGALYEIGGRTCAPTPTAPLWALNVQFRIKRRASSRSPLPAPVPPPHPHPLLTHRPPSPSRGHEPWRVTAPSGGGQRHC